MKRTGWTVSDLPAGTAWAYGSHVFVSIWDAEPMKEPETEETE